MNLTFKKIVDQRLSGVEWTEEQSKHILQPQPARKPIPRRLAMVVVLCIGLLCITAAALAFTIPGILQRLYGNESAVTGKQMDMVQSVSTATQASGITVSVKEIIYDGQRLAVYWSIVSTADEPILITHGSGSTFDGLRLYQDFSSLGVVEGQVILPGETLDGGFISEPGLLTETDTATAVLQFLTFTLTKPVVLISSETEYDTALLQAVYTQSDCIAINENTHIIALDPMLDPDTIDTGDSTAMNQYEAYGLVDYADEMLLEFTVDATDLSQYNDFTITQTVSSDIYPATLNTVTLSPVTTYFAFTITLPKAYTEAEAAAFKQTLEIRYTDGSASPLKFLQGEYTASLSVDEHRSGTYTITGEYPLPGLIETTDEVLLTIQNIENGTIYAQFLIVTP